MEGNRSHISIFVAAGARCMQPVLTSWGKMHTGPRARRHLASAATCRCPDLQQRAGESLHATSAVRAPPPHPQAAQGPEPASHQRGCRAGCRRWRQENFALPSGGCCGRSRSAGSLALQRCLAALPWLWALVSNEHDRLGEPGASWAPRLQIPGVVVNCLWKGY